MLQAYGFLLLKFLFLENTDVSFFRQVLQIGRIFDIELADDVAAKQILAKKVAILRR